MTLLLLSLFLILFVHATHAAFINTFIGSDTCTPQQSYSVQTLELPSTGQCGPTKQLFDASLTCLRHNTTWIGEYITSCHSIAPVIVFTSTPERLCYNATRFMNEYRIVESFSFLCDQTEDASPFPLYFPTAHAARRHRMRERE
jgi:hypothetical protein